MNSLKNKILKISGLEYTYPKVKQELKLFSQQYSIENQYQMPIDIIMPTYNRFRETKRTINNLLKNLKIKFNLIIVDNNSLDGTKEYLEDLANKHTNLKLILLKENLGGSGARIEGLKHVQNEYVAFLDNDIITMPFYFENLINALETHKDVIAVQSKVVLPNKLIQINKPYYKINNQWIQFFDEDYEKNYYDASTLSQSQLNSIPIGATLWRSEIFKKYSLDAEMGTSYEDNDLAFRLSKDGYQFINCPGAICLHIPSLFAPEDKPSDYNKARFGLETVRKSAQTFYKKHGLLFSFGDPEKYTKYIGFVNVEEYISFIKS
jgi:GT2 family glycosyltransferase